MRNGVAGNDGIRVHADENRFVVAKVLQPEIQRLGFASIRFGNHNQVPDENWTGDARRENSSVLSVDPSSITTTRRLG